MGTQKTLRDKIADLILEGALFHNSDYVRETIAGKSNASEGARKRLKDDLDDANNTADTILNLIEADDEAFREGLRQHKERAA